MSIHLKPHKDFPNTILVRVFSGRVEIGDILNSWKSIGDSPLLTHQINGIINDLSNCELCMDMEGFKKLIEFLKDQDYLKTVKLAVITDSPQTIVFPMLGETQEKDLMIKPFCTEQAAVNWILNE